MNTTTAAPGSSSEMAPIANTTPTKTSSRRFKTTKKACAGTGSSSFTTSPSPSFASSSAALTPKASQPKPKIILKGARIVLVDAAQPLSTPWQSFSAEDFEANKDKLAGPPTQAVEVPAWKMGGAGTIGGWRAKVAYREAEQEQDRYAYRREGVYWDPEEGKGKGKAWENKSWR